MTHSWPRYAPFCKAGLLDYALGQHDPDGDLCPSGRSVVETVEMHAGFETIDVAAYMSDALGRLADMSRALGDAALADALAEKSAALGQGIRQGWWMEDEGLFADVRASVGEVQRVLSDLDRHIAEQDWLTLDQQRAVETARRLFAPGLLREAQRDVDLPGCFATGWCCVRLRRASPRRSRPSAAWTACKARSSATHGACICIRSART